MPEIGLDSACPKGGRQRYYKVADEEELPGEGTTA
jgi:hypothetical protein